MNAIGYVRISIKDQSRWSLASQEKYIREYCARNQVELLEMFVDDGKKSYTFDRPDYIALERFIKKHKGTVQYLIVLDHDRFSRNLAEALMKIEYLEKKHGLKVLATNEPLDLDTADPMVFMQRAFKYMMANQELFTIRRRAKMGIRQASESGRFVHLAPFGYKNCKETGGKSMLIIDDTKSFIIKKIFRDYLSGIPHYLILESVKNMGFNRTGRDAIVRVLNNSVYAGIIRVAADDKHPEKFVQGVHEPIITEEQFWRAQDMLGNNKRIQKAQFRNDFPLRGFLTCGCGGTMTAGFSKGKKNYYLYYRCNRHSNINIPGTVIHRQLDELLELLSFSQGQVEHMVSRAKGALEEAIAIYSKQAAVKTVELQDVNIKIDKLEEKIVNDEIEPETYRKYYKKYQYDKARLTDELGHLKGLNGDRLDEQLALLPHLASLSAMFEKANINQKHSLLKGVFKHGMTYSEGAFRTPWINPAFTHNLQIINKKGLLFLEQPSPEFDTIPCGAEEGTRTPTPRGARS
jgi:site-specific DNA recombinase